MCVGVVIPTKLYNIGNGLIRLPQHAGLYIAAINDWKVNAFNPYLVHLKMEITTYLILYREITKATYSSLLHAMVIKLGETSFRFLIRFEETVPEVL